MTPEAPLYIYAVCRVPERGLVLPPGIEQDTILVEQAGLGAIAEPGLDLAALEADDQRLLTAVLTHDQVICDLFQQTTVLPLRFGIQLISQAGLEAHLQENQKTYRRKLALLADKAEYQIKLMPAEMVVSPLPEGLTGRDYFLAKKIRLQTQAEEQQRQQEELNQLISGLQSTYPDLQTATSDEGLPRLYLLLSKTQAKELLQQAEFWQRQMPHWQLSLSEALPPYHFVS
ncbi:MAG TPA: GvpL/GvpF family gas vesicle protein [Leptolyngbyaceae cyanobacterium]